MLLRLPTKELRREAIFKKDGKTVNGIEIRIQTLIVRGKKIIRFF